MTYKILQKRKRASSCIYLILTNNAMAFQNTTTVFTGLSDFHKLVLTVLKTSITKSKPQKITHRDYKSFDSVRFNGELKCVLQKRKLRLLLSSMKCFYEH